MPPRTADPRPRAEAALNGLAGDLPALGIALSGGGDSHALMWLIQAWARKRSPRPRLHAVTVDHGLRPESAREAQRAAKMAAALDIPHQVLRWRHPGEAPPGGNLMASARQARQRLIADWAQAQDLPAVALGHHRDDVAETLLMRLMRGSGIDGLAAMAPAHRAQGMLWLRPLLDLTRQELRDVLRAQGLSWIEDPTNDDPRFDRARIRQVIAALDLPAAQLAQSANALAEARATLADIAVIAAKDTRATHGTLDLPAAALLDGPAEIRRRLLVAATRWIAAAPYPPRREAVAQAMAFLAEGKRAVLHGAMVLPRGGRVHVLREPAPARRAPMLIGDDSGAGIWDNRWRVTGLRPGDQIGALGPDAAAYDRRAHGLSRAEAETLPTLRRNGAIFAVALLDPTAEIAFSPLRDADDFIAMLMAH